MPKRTEDNISVGPKFESKQGDKFTILEVKDMSNITIVFDGYNNYPTIRSKWLIETGQIKNFYKPSIYGVGYMGEGLYKSSRGHPVYKVWYNMLRRCYNPETREYNRYGERGVVVCKDWHNYQNFRSWYEENYIQDYQLDKDLKDPSSKVYSPETCVFVPSQINKLLISNNKFRSSLGVGVNPTSNGKFQSGFNCFSERKHLGTFATADEAFEAYKDAKESHIKVVANLYKDVLHKDVYTTLMNWEVLRYPE